MRMIFRCVRIVCAAACAAITIVIMLMGPPEMVWAIFPALLAIVCFKGSRNLVIATWAMLAVGFLIIAYASWSVRTLRWPAAHANQLIGSVGGPAKVCDEATGVFERFGTQEERVLTSCDLKEYPAIAALGTWTHILPGTPPRISIIVETPWYTYFIVIVDTDGPEKFVKPPHYRELIDSRVFVHR
jgi:hypothetical protein